MQKIRGYETTPAPGDVVVYPSHGIGTLSAIETQRIGREDVLLLKIDFAQNGMTLRVPMRKIEASGLRSLSTPRVMQDALAKLKEPARKQSGIWNRRFVGYTTKIKSGDPILIAEVVRDLHQVTGEKEPSHSQRLLYEEALYRLTHEVAAVEQTSLDVATAKLEGLLSAA